MSYAFLSRAVIKADITHTLLISNKNHKYICKILRRETLKMNFPSLKVYRKLSKLCELLKEAPKKQLSGSRRNTLTS